VRRVVIAVVLLALAAACSDDDEPATIDRDGSEVVSSPATVEVGAPVDSYRITYRVQQRDGDDVLERDAVLTVRRPWQSRFEIEDILRVADFAYFGEEEPGDETEVVTAVPTPAPGDVRADVIDLGETDDVRRVAGRLCAVHRFGASLLDGLYVEGDTVEDCIDEEGLVLEEITYLDGEPDTRRVATDVVIDPPDDVAFEIDGIEPRSADDGGGSIQEIEPTSAPPGAFWELAAAPDGFEHVGRYAMVPPQAARLDDEESRPRYIAGVVDVWARGVDVVIVDQGGTLGQVPPFGVDPHGEPINDLGEVGVTGELVRHPFGAEVRILIPPGRFVKVRGTLPVDDLLDVVRSLRPIEGTGLVYVEEEG
jgi:hypothetical protein